MGPEYWYTVDKVTAYLETSPSVPRVHRNTFVSAKELYNQPMLTHEKAITRLGRYLYHTKREGIVYNLDTSKGLECYVDADFI